MPSFLVDHKSFLNSLNTISLALPTKTSLPLLTNVYIEAKENGLKLAATDLDTTIITHQAATVSSQGTVTLPGKKLLEIIREFPDEDVSVHSTGSRTTISCGKSSFTLPGTDGKNYPTLPQHNAESTKIEFPTEAVKKGIKKTFYAVAGSNEIRPFLTGSFWKYNAEGLEMVATDGHRLAKVKITEVGGQPETEAIIPQKTLNLLLKLSTDETIAYSIQGSTISFITGKTHIYCRGLEGPYPPYNKVIPQNNTKKAIINKNELYLALKRMNIVANSATHQVMFTIEHNKLILNTEKTELGEGREDLEAVFEDKPIQLAFDCHLIIDILRTMESENIVFNIHDAQTAVIITEESQEEGFDYLALVMPIRLPDKRRPDEKR